MVIRDLAGNIGLSMLRDKELAVAGLTNANANVRRAAVLVTGEIWCANIDSGAMFLDIFENDSDDAVRMSALTIVSRLFFETKDSTALRTLAQCVSNIRDNAHLRKAAYSFLYSIDGASIDTWPLLREGFVFPDDVNWEWVESYAKS